MTGPRGKTDNEAVSGWEIAVWISFCVVLAAGLAGTILPFMPGPSLIFLAALSHKLLLPDRLSWWTVSAAGLLIGADLWLTALGGVAGAKWGGAGKAGMIGAALGLAVGAFFGPPGLLAGPLAGALLGELFYAGRTLREASRAALGAGLGLASSAAARVLLALGLLALIAADCLIF